MEVARGEILARPGLAGQQHGHRGLRRTVELGEHAPGRVAARDEPGRWLAGRDVDRELGAAVARVRRGSSGVEREHVVGAGEHRGRRIARVELAAC